MKIDNYCLNHSNQLIEFICVNKECDNQLICRKCFTTGGYHRGHTIDEISLENTTLLIKEFKTINYPQLEKCIQADKKIDNESDSILGGLERKHREYLECIELEFKQLHNVLSINEIDIKRRLSTILDENKEVNTLIKSKILHTSDEITTVLNAHKDNLTNYDNANYIKQEIYNESTQQHIEILKHNQMVKHILQSSPSNNNNNNNNELIYQLSQYKETLFSFNRDAISSLKDSLKFIYKIDSNLIKQTPPPPPVEPLPKTFEYSGIIGIIYEQGVTVPVGTKTMGLSGEIGSEAGKLQVGSIPNTVEKLFIMDGFDQSLESGYIPSSVTTLFIGKIGSSSSSTASSGVFKENSIPSSCTDIILMDDFNQQISQLPSSVQRFFIGNIKSTIHFSNLPTSIKQFSKTLNCNTSLLSGFEHVRFNSCCIPKLKFFT